MTNNDEGVHNENVDNDNKAFNNKDLDNNNMGFNEHYLDNNNNTVFNDSNNSHLETQNPILNNSEIATTEKKVSVLREVLDWALHIGAAVVIALLIVKFVAQVTVVIGSSMNPTLQNGNRLIMEKLTNRFGEFKKGDIVVIEAKNELANAGFPINHSPLIKRIIGVAGDNVRVEGGNVYVNGNKMNETYINGNFTETQRYSDVTVPAEHIFVMGDNRKPGMSVDSRELGIFEVSKVVGRVFLRLYPLDEFGGLY